MLDTSNWKIYRISDLFDVELSKGDLKQGEQDPGLVPLVSSGSRNNGIVDYISPKGDGKAEIFPANTITVDMFCKAYYQPYDYYAVSHGRVNILKPKFKLSKNIALFICSLINYEGYRFCYGRGVYSNVIADLEIKLPADSSGKPQWKDIEQYIDMLTINIPKTKNKRSAFIKPVTEHLFKISEVFDQIVPTKGTTTDDLVVGSDISYIGATKVMNGLLDSVAREGNEEFISDGNCVVFVQLGAGGAGYATYQNKEFIGMSGKTCCGYSKQLNKYNGLFLATILCQERFRYSFGRSWTGNRLLNTTIKLPAKLNAHGKYEPDWQYMENYVKSLPYGDII